MLIILIILTACSKQQFKAPIVPEVSPKTAEPLIDSAGSQVITRFLPPAGYHRTSVPANSFADYLRHLPVKPAGTTVKYFNGAEKTKDVYEAVVDMAISDKDLQQCADAIIRLRAEYFYSIRAYDRISFKLTNGFTMDYTDWAEGKRVVVNGNKTFWQQTAQPSDSYQNFRDYLEFVFMYAGTLSLAQTLKSQRIEDLGIGDVFIVGGSPGHAVIVVDLAENEKGDKAFLLAQSYMPAQETQILKNKNEQALSPWYLASAIDTELKTPEWKFEREQLMTWQ